MPGELGKETMTQSNAQSESPENLKNIYGARFSGHQAYRNEVWRILTSLGEHLRRPDISKVVAHPCLCNRMRHQHANQ